MANVDLPADQVRGQVAVAAMLSQDRQAARDKLRTELGRVKSVVGISPSVDDEQLDEALDQLNESGKRQLAAAMAIEHANSTAGYEKYWQIIISTPATCWSPTIRF